MPPHHAQAQSILPLHIRYLLATVDTLVDTLVTSFYRKSVAQEKSVAQVELSQPCEPPAHSEMLHDFRRNHYPNPN